MKKCSKCKVEKPRSEFNRHAKARDGLYHRCRECDRAARRACRQKWREVNATVEPTLIEKRCRKCDTVKPRAAFARERSSKDGLRGKCTECENKRVSTRYVRTCLPDFYLMPRDNYKAYRDEIDERCEITGNPCRTLVIDHDHRTGLVRGFISNQQNAQIGSDEGMRGRLLARAQNRKLNKKARENARRRYEYVRDRDLEFQIALTARLFNKSPEYVREIAEKNLASGEKITAARPRKRTQEAVSEAHI